MEIKLIKNIAAIVFDVNDDRYKYEDNYQKLIDTIALDTSYKIHVFVSGTSYNSISYADYILEILDTGICRSFFDSIIEMNSVNRPIFVHAYKGLIWSNYHSSYYKHNNFTFINDKDVLLGDILFYKKRGKYHYKKIDKDSEK